MAYTPPLTQLPVPARCPACGSINLSWGMTKTGGGSAPLDGRLRMHDVLVSLTLGCDECSETVANLDDAALNELIGRPFDLVGQVSPAIVSR